MDLVLRPESEICSLRINNCYEPVHLTHCTIMLELIGFFRLVTRYGWCWVTTQHKLQSIHWCFNGVSTLQCLKQRIKQTPYTRANQMWDDYDWHTSVTAAQRNVSGNELKCAAFFLAALLGFPWLFTVTPWSVMLPAFLECWRKPGTRG